MKHFECHTGRRETTLSIIVTMSTETEDHKLEDKVKEEEDAEDPKKDDGGDESPSKDAQASSAVVDSTQDSTGNEHDDENGKNDDDKSDSKMESSESKLLKDLDDEAPKTFPQILMEILNNEEESDTIAFLPHGRSFSEF